MSLGSARRPSAALAATLLVAAVPQAALAQARAVPDTFTATTTDDMTPAGITLKIDVLEWSDDSARAAVIAALTNEAETSEPLAELPTIGYVWPSGSAVGYALKYAHRMSTTGDGERVTFVTDKPLGSYGFAPWAADGQSPSALDYSVIDLQLTAEGDGVGTLSLAADVVFDQETHAVSLATPDSGTKLLTGGRREPKPYWAQGKEGLEATQGAQGS